MWAIGVKGGYKSRWLTPASRSTIRQNTPASASLPPTTFFVDVKVDGSFAITGGAMSEQTAAAEPMGTVGSLRTRAD